MNKKEIEITRAIAIILLIALAILLNSCEDQFNIRTSCDEKIEYWEAVLNAEIIKERKDVNSERIFRIKMIIQETKEACQ